MRKIVFLSILSLSACFAQASRAGVPNEFKINEVCIDAGYGLALISMGDLNNNINSMAGQALQAGFSVKKQNVSNAQGFYADMGLAFSAFPGFSADLRSGWLCSNSAGFDSFRRQIYDRTWNNKLGSSMFPVLAGVSYSASLPFLRATAGASLYAGAGFASASWQSYFATNDPGFTPQDIAGWNFLIPAAGTSLVCELHASIGINLWGPAFLKLDFGYRFADFPYLYITKNVNGTFAGDLKPGDTALAPDGSVLSLDFSGLDLGAGLNIVF